MKLVIVSPFLPYPPDSGGAIRIYNLLKHLAKRHDVTLLCGVDEKQQTLAEALQPYCRLVCVPEKKESRRWFGHLRFAFSSLPYSLVMVDDELKLRMREIVSPDTDIVQFEFLPLAHYHTCLPPSVKKVAVVHYIATESRKRLIRLWPFNLRKLYYAFQIPKIERYERSVLKFFDLCLVTSRTHGRKLRDWGITAPIHLSPNGVDLDYFSDRWTAHEKTPRIAYMGAFHLEPANIDGFVFLMEDILPVIKRSIPEVELDIIGKGLPETLINRHRSDSVHIHGYVEDIRPILAAADVFVIPLRGGSGTKIRILTAMAMGIPVVGTTLAADGIPVVNHKHMVVADDPDVIAENIIGLIDDPQKKQALGRAGRTLVADGYS